MRTVKLAGLDIAYRLAGDENSPPVLLIHGFSGSHRNWAFTARALNESGWRTLSPDNPGHGVSSAPDDATRYSMQNTATLLHRLAEQVGCLPAVVIGHSLGGAIAEALALQFPASITALVLVGSAGGAHAVRHSNARHLPELKTAFDNGGMKAVFDKQIELGLRRCPENFSSLMLTLHRREFAKTSWQGFEYAGRALGSREESLSGLARWQKPTLIVNGEKDYPRQIKIANDLQRVIRHARRAIIPNAGHNPQIEAPKSFNRVLLDFLISNSH